jgi:hypothetical protein
VIGRSTCAGLLAVLLLWGSSAAADDEFTNCSDPVGEFPGAEDFEVDASRPGRTRLLVSSLARPANTDGALWSLPVTAAGLGEAVKLVDAVDGCPLRPHGISLVGRRAAAPRLYVINHRSDDDPEACRCARRGPDGCLLHTIEVFDVGVDALAHVETLADPLVRSPNDLAATAEGELYVTNEVTYQSVWRRLAEMLGLSSSSYVAHFAQGRWERMAEGIFYANGIAVDDGHVYVAGLMDQMIHVYERSGSGDAVASLSLGSHVDNLLWGSEPGQLFAAAHPSLLAVARHAGGFLETAPSEAYRIDVPTRSVRRIHRSGGEHARAASAAVVWDDVLYLGQVVAPGIGRCTRGSSVGFARGP